MMMSIEIIIFGSLVFFLSALLQGLSGFGFSILAIPLISFFIAPRASVPTLLIYSMVINIAVLVSTKKAINLKSIWLLLVGALLAIPLGTRMLIVLPENLIRLIIGILILVFGILLLTGSHIRFLNSRFIMLPIGFISGALGACVSISGPPVIIYFTNQGTQKHEFRGNLAIYFFLLNIFTFPVFYLNGLFTPQVIKNTLLFSPGLLAGVLIGSFLSHKIHDQHFRKITLYLLLIMGISTIFSVIF